MKSRTFFHQNAMKNQIVVFMPSYIALPDPSEQAIKTEGPQ